MDCSNKNRFWLYAVAILCILPFLIVFIFSLVFDNKIGLLQYVFLLVQNPIFIKGFWNSMLYTGTILVFHIPISIFSAYFFTFFKVKNKTLLYGIYIVLMLMPFQAVLLQIGRASCRERVYVLV